MGVQSATRSVRGRRARIANGTGSATGATPARQIITLPVVGPVSRTQAALLAGALLLVIVLVAAGGGGGDEPQRITIT